jgi:hypothetical protein
MNCRDPLLPEGKLIDFLNSIEGEIPKLPTQILAEGNSDEPEKA